MTFAYLSFLGITILHREAGGGILIYSLGWWAGKDAFDGLMRWNFDTKIPKSG